MSTENNSSKKNHILKGTAVVMSAGMLANSMASAIYPTVLAADKKEARPGSTSGVVSKLNQAAADALSSGEDLNVQSSGVESVEASEDTASDEWASRLMVNVNSRVNVRDGASIEANRVGALRPGDVAEIIGEENGWYQIQSGSLTGYVSGEYVVTGEAAKEQAAVLYKEEATSNVNGLHVRAEASTDSAILSGLNENQSLDIAEDAAQVDGWVAVNYSGTTAYVSADYVNVAADTDYSTGVTAEEEAEAARQAAEAAAAEAAKKAAAAQQNAAVAASQDETAVLAAICQLEAGNSYQGMVAVGAVVLNRVADGRYPGSISGVVYQRGQFSPAGRVSSLIASGGVSSAAYAAAQEALAGSDPTGGCLSFRSARTGHAGTNIGGNVFF